MFYAWLYFCTTDGKTQVFPKVSVDLWITFAAVNHCRFLMLSLTINIEKAKCINIINEFSFFVLLLNF